MVNQTRALVAEFVGTFALIFIGALAIVTDQHTGGQVGLLGVAVAHGLILALMINATGHISGGLFNPAVTVGLWAARKLETARVLPFIIAQLLGGAAGGFAVRAVSPAAAAAAAGLGTPIPAAGVGFGQAILIEAILTFFLMFAIMGTAADPRGPKGFPGWAIGLVLTADILAGGPFTGAAMNPARTFGPAIAGGPWDGHLVYWIGPIIGALVAAVLYNRVLEQD